MAYSTGCFRTVTEQDNWIRQLNLSTIYTYARWIPFGVAEPDRTNGLEMYSTGRFRAVSKWLDRVKQSDFMQVSLFPEL